MPDDRKPDTAVEDDDPEAPLSSSVPLDTDEGTTVVRQQNVDQESEAGSGEWPDPETRPRPPAPGAD